MQLQELNDHFMEVNIELLLCVACLCPNDSFSSFDKKKLICLAKYYLEDFSALDLMKREYQLETYIRMCALVRSLQDKRALVILVNRMGD